MLVTVGGRVKGYEEKHTHNKKKMKPATKSEKSL